MTRLERVTNKIFGSTASIVGTEEFGPEIGQFGSAKLGTYVATNDIAQIQGLSAWDNGWIDAVIPNQQYPTLPEMTGFGKVVTQQISYLMQEGIAEWDASTTYYKESLVKYIPTTTTYSTSASIGDSTGITSASVVNNTFITQITLAGSYDFIYDGSNWTYDGLTTNLTLYGITYTGTPAEGDTITITLTVTVTLQELVLYRSLTDNNTNNNPQTSTANWKQIDFTGNLQQQIDQINSTLNNKANISLNNVTTTSGFRKLVSVYDNGISGYKIFQEYNPTTGTYIGRWCEEYGETAGVSGERNINFSNTFRYTQYNASFCWGVMDYFNATTNTVIQNISLVNATSTGFQIKTGVTTPIRWRVSGYLST